MLRIFPFMREFKITGCYLTYKDLNDIIRCGNGMSQLICLSGNKFVNEQGDNSTTEQIEKQITCNSWSHSSYTVVRHAKNLQIFRKRRMTPLS